MRKGQYTGGILLDRNKSYERQGRQSLQYLKHPAPELSYRNLLQFQGRSIDRESVRSLELSEVRT
jgi:hypothetical protein